jgi:hypothetical protein
MRTDVERQPSHVARVAIHVEFEDARAHEDALRAMSVFNIASRSASVRLKKIPPHATLVLNDPIPLPVLTDHK